MSFSASQAHQLARIAERWVVGWVVACLTWSVVMVATPSIQAATPEARVSRVHVSLDVQQTRAHRPDGERPPLGGGLVRAYARYHLDRAGTFARELWLLNYAEQMIAEPGSLDEIQLRALFDGPFHPGRLDIVAVTVEGEPAKWGRRGDRRDVVVDIPPGATRVDIEYRVVVPRKYWPFGCSRDRCSLDAAIAPLPSRPARGGVHLPRDGRVIDPVAWSVDDATVDGSSEATWFASRAPFAPPPQLRRRDDLLLVADASSSPLGVSAYPSVFWGRGWHRSREVVAGTYVTVLDTRPRPAGRWPHESAGQLHRDRAGRLLAIAGETLGLTMRRGLTRPPDQTQFVVVGPLRSSVAAMHPNAVVVSDQAYELFPSERLTKFHDVVIARACLEQITTGWVAGRHDPSVDGWLGGMLGFALTSAWERERSLRDEFAQDILAKFTFMPAVDRFLYSGQASFSSAYFRGSEDGHIVRDHPLLFSHSLPTGRRIHEKLSDLMSDEAMLGLYDELIASPQLDPYRAAERAYGHRLHWFFDQWLGPYPDVDYVLDRVETRRTPTGYEHAIDVVRNGEVPLLEPVQLLVVERGGTPHFLVWNGDVLGPHDQASTDEREVRHRFELTTTRPLKTIRVDPRMRLHETSRVGLTADHRADNFDPMFNNRRPAKPRFLYTGLGFDIAASEFANAMTPRARFNAFSGFASFAGGLQRDLRRAGTLHVFTDRETLVGAGGGVNFYFLEKINRQRRRLRVRLSLTPSSLKGANLDGRGGSGFTETVSISDDTRRYNFWPERGHRLSLYASARQVVRDGSLMRQDVRAGAGWQQLWRVAHGHVFVHNFEVSMLAPIASDLEFRSLLRVGGIDGLSAYLADEIFGRALALAQFEYRHMLSRNLGVNLLHAAWWQHVSGSAFVGAATISSCEDYSGWFERDSWYAQAGYGLMASVRVLGVTPQLIRLDTAVPLSDRFRERECLGERFPGYLAEVQGLSPASVGSLLTDLSINLTFTQPF